MEPQSTKFLGQAFESGDDTRIAVPATRKHDTPINCILCVSHMVKLFKRAKKRFQIKVNDAGSKDKVSSWAFEAARILETADTASLYYSGLPMVSADHQGGCDV